MEVGAVRKKENIDLTSKAPCEKPRGWKGLPYPVVPLNS